MAHTVLVGKNPKASSSTRASTMSGYRAVNCGRHSLDHMVRPHTKTRQIVSAYCVKKVETDKTQKNLMGHTIPAMSPPINKKRL